MEQKKNKFGMYDAPTGQQEEDRVLSKQDMTARLEQGAFMITREEAIKKGFLTKEETVPVAYMKESLTVEG